ncbi:MAG: hypothetical protein GYA16_11710 [Spirochaetes bacterium]|nr:hypothetical protein [Spirochaetota bacterium]
MKKSIVCLTVLWLMMHVSSGQSEHMHHGHEGGKSTHKAMGTMVFQAQKDGLSIEVYLNDVKTAMEQMMKESGMKFDASKLDPDITHHMSVFVEGKDAGTIKSATVDIKSKNISKTYTLFHMKNHYGSDVSLKNKGNYEAIITFNTEKKTGLQFRFTFSI